MNRNQIVFFVVFLFAAIFWPLIGAALPPTAAPLAELTCNTLESIPITISTHATGEKPQSKVWEHGGTWWTVFPTDSSGASQSGTWLWKLVGDAWVEELRLSNETGTRADVINAGDIAHILLHDGSPELVSVEYSNGSYALWSERPLSSEITLSGSETATITLDSTNRLWLVADASRKIVAYHSEFPYDSWSSSIDIATGIASDDIAGIITSPNKYIGVLWSDQNDREFGFRIHHDADLPGTWQTTEVAGTSADDHINMATSADGRIYAAVKTQTDIIRLLVRETDGTWNHHDVDKRNIGTRPIVVVNDAAGVVTVLYTERNGFNPIVYKETDVNNIDFSGDRQTLDNGRYNNVSSTKQSYSNALVIIYANRNDVAGVHCAEEVDATLTPTSLPSPTATATTLPTATPTTTPNVTLTAVPTPEIYPYDVSLPIIRHTVFFDEP